jgi:DNA-binding NarL/FixJ family response regulator
VQPKEQLVSQTAVVLVHAHTLFREGLRRNIAAHPDFYVTGEATNGQQVIQFVDYNTPDLVVIEFDLPGINGLEVARTIKRSHPHIKIVLLAPDTDGQRVVMAIRAGVAAYVPRNVAWETLLATLQETRRGRYPINDLVLSSPAVAAQVLASFRQLAVDEEIQRVYSPLSRRELDVLELVADGRTNKEIAANLDISNQTVKNHVSSILRKLAVNDRTQAVVYAMRHGWLKVELPDD